MRILIKWLIWLENYLKSLIKLRDLKRFLLHILLSLQQLHSSLLLSYQQCLAMQHLCRIFRSFSIHETYHFSENSTLILHSCSRYRHSIHIRLYNKNQISSAWHYLSNKYQWFKLSNLVSQRSLSILSILTWFCSTMSLFANSMSSRSFSI